MKSVCAVCTAINQRTMEIAVAAIATGYAVFAVVGYLGFRVGSKEMVTYAFAALGFAVVVAMPGVLKASPLTTYYIRGPALLILSLSCVIAGMLISWYALD